MGARASSRQTTLAQGVRARCAQSPGSLEPTPSPGSPSLCSSRTAGGILKSLVEQPNQTTSRRTINSLFLPWLNTAERRPRQLLPRGMERAGFFFCLGLCVHGAHAARGCCRQRGSHQSLAPGAAQLLALTSKRNAHLSTAHGSRAERGLRCGSCIP